MMNQYSMPATFSMMIIRGKLLIMSTVGLFAAEHLCASWVSCS